MLGMRLPTRSRIRDEGEKPFWISFSDLMSALMVLFLVATTVALLAVTHEISQAEREKIEREQEIEAFMARVREAISEFPGVSVRQRAIDFGERARFASDSHQLAREQTRLLRAVVPRILEVAREPLGQRRFKRVIVEGFADPRGSYLHNLNLSLQRSERVLCALLVPGRGEAALSEADRLFIRERFLVGGFSFNAQKASLEESRRIELKLDFLEVGEQPPQAATPALEAEDRCPLD
jgi:outer membrane protein OmpA-like peptidoglycan-associated protein